MDRQILNTVDDFTVQPLLLPTVILCPECGTPWSADYLDYIWMRENDLIICSCGKSLCEVKELIVE